MKKNLISVVILALMLVNIIVSSVTMFSVTSTNQKTAAVINKISSMVDLQVTESAPTSSTQESVSLEKRRFLTTFMCSIGINNARISAINLSQQ